MSGGWRQRFRARVALHDLAGAGERLFDTAEAMLRSENARVAVIEAIEAARAEGIAEAEIEAELRAYRAEQFTLERFVTVTCLVVAERRQRYPELRGPGWATLAEVARQGGVDEQLAGARYATALVRQLVREVEVPLAARMPGPAFAPKIGGDV